MRVADLRGNVAGARLLKKALREERLAARRDLEPRKRQGDPVEKSLPDRSEGSIG